MLMKGRTHRSLGEEEMTGYGVRGRGDHWVWGEGEGDHWVWGEGEGRSLGMG